LGLICALCAYAHDIPADVTTHVFLKPEGKRLSMTVRVPLSAIRDIVFPERESGYLDREKAAPLLPDAAMLWIGNSVEIYENGVALARPRVVATKLSPDTNVVWNQATLDAEFEYAIQSDRSEFSIHPGLARLGLRVVTALRFLPPGGAVRAFEFIGDPGVVRLDPRWHQAALRFVQLGFEHILGGTDHLLFLACLVIPFRRFRALIPVVTSFTAAHSITLIASAYNLAPDGLWFPPLIETAIAASIVYMALENIVGGATVNRRWMMAFGFGLIHGFGFSFALRQTMQFAGSYLLTSLVSFNAGVELGQLLVLAMLIPVLDLLFRRVVEERMGTIILSALVAHTGWHWMTERWDRLRQYRIELPAVTAGSVAALLRWLMLVAIAAALVWGVKRLLSSRLSSKLGPSGSSTS